MKWVEALWAELDGKEDVDQITSSGEWIVTITQQLLPALGARRREKVLAVLDNPEWDYTRLAESIGSRTTAIKRLAEEGRANRRERIQRQ